MVDRVTISVGRKYNGSSSTLSRGVRRAPGLMMRSRTRGATTRDRSSSRCGCCKLTTYGRSSRPERIGFRKTSYCRIIEVQQLFTEHTVALDVRVVRVDKLLVLLGPTPSALIFQM